MIFLLGGSYAEPLGAIPGRTDMGAHGLLEDLLVIVSIKAGS